jgi:hypothetical protein
MGRLDHAMINVAIAGSFTRFGLLVLSGPVAIVCMILVWAPPALQADSRPCTRHVGTNLVVELRSVDRAVARSYFTVFQARPDFPLQPIIVGRYHFAVSDTSAPWPSTPRPWRRSVSHLSPAA